MKNMETRIKSIAANMEGKYCGIVPHTVYVEWDATWDIADDLGLDENSTDKEIEEAIRIRELWYDDAYQEELQAYIDEQENN